MGIGDMAEAAKTLWPGWRVVEVREHKLLKGVELKGMVSLELMAEACAALAGRTDLGVIENVKAFDWIALDDGAIDIEVRARVIDRDRQHYAAEVITPRGIAVSGEFRFDRDWRLGPVAPLVAPRPWDIHVPSLYTTDRHGHLRMERHPRLRQSQPLARGIRERRRPRQPAEHPRLPVGLRPLSQL